MEVMGIYNYTDLLKDQCYDEEKITMNKLGVINNKAQGSFKKVLCVCSAGILRSPTISRVLDREFDYNTRAVGYSKEYALIPLTDALILWADEIVTADIDTCEHVESRVHELFKNSISSETVSIYCLNIPDIYNCFDSELYNMILNRYKMVNPDV